MFAERFGRSLCLVATLVGGAIVARADDTPAPVTQPVAERPNNLPDPDTLVQRFREQISSMTLSDEQKQKVDDAMSKAEQSLKMLDSELQNATQGQRAQRVRDIFKDLREQVRSALSPEQQKELRRKISSGASDRMKRLHDALAKIDLSDDQKQKIQSLLEDARSKFEEARKAGAAGGQEGTEKLQAAGAELREKLAQLLTDDQREKLRNLMENPSAPATQPTTSK